MVEKIKGITVKQLAEETGVKLDRLLDQFEKAGIKIKGAAEIVSEDKKQELLRYLHQQHHGAKESVSDKIILRRAKTSEIKLGGSHGAGKTVSIQVRKKRTYIKRPVAEEEQKVKAGEVKITETLPVESAAALEKQLLITTELAGASKETGTEVVAPAKSDMPTVAEQETYVEEIPVAPVVAEEKPEEKAKAALKRKDKHRNAGELEEIESE